MALWTEHSVHWRHWLQPRSHRTSRLSIIDRQSYAQLIGQSRRLIRHPVSPAPLSTTVRCLCGNFLSRRWHIVQVMSVQSGPEKWEHSAFCLFQRTYCLGASQNCPKRCTKSQTRCSVCPPCTQIRNCRRRCQWSILMLMIRCESMRRHTRHTELSTFCKTKRWLHGSTHVTPNRPHINPVDSAVGFISSVLLYYCRKFCIVEELNPFKPSGAKWLLYKVFKVILV